MAKAYYSTILESDPNRVWALVRDFNSYPSYIDGVDQSVIEDDKPGDAVGAVRRFRYKGKWERQRLIAHSDTERTFTYAGLSPLSFPEKDSNSPAPITYQGTLRISPVVDGEGSFIEWSVTFDASPKDSERWLAFLVPSIAKWVASLRASLS